MIGEVRDAETAQIVAEAALTGHLLLSTIHSDSPAAAIVRLKEMGLPAYQLTSTIRAILAQRLLRTTCSACGGAAETECATCRGSGYVGRSAVGCLIEMTAALREAILSESDVDELARRTPATDSLRQDAQRLLDAGTTTPEEVRRVLGA
jgi:general secretion pathway protein E